MLDTSIRTCFDVGMRKSEMDIIESFTSERYEDPSNFMAHATISKLKGESIFSHLSERPWRPIDGWDFAPTRHVDVIRSVWILNRYVNDLYAAAYLDYRSVSDYIFMASLQYILSFNNMCEALHKKHEDS